MLIDVFHDGEVLLTAVSLLQGGRPFVDLNWPHGLHDTGIAALWIAATGKVGSSPVMLTRATTAALAPWTLYLMLRGAVPSSRASALAAWLVLLSFWCVPEPGIQRVLLLTTGVLFGAAVACSLVAGERAHPWAVGIALGLGMVFRIEVGIWSVVAVAWVLALRALLADGPIATRFGRLARDGLRVAAGLALCHLALRGMFGWPDATWYSHTLGTLPRLHSLANGERVPWPSEVRSLGAAAATAAVLSPLVLMAVAFRAVGRSLRWASSSARPPVADGRFWLLAFLSVAALGALRSSIGRSEISHIVYFSVPLLALAMALAASPSLVRFCERPRRARNLLAVLAVGLGAAILISDDRPLPQLIQHLRPNPPVGRCADVSFTPMEAAHPFNASFIAHTCQVERLLRRNSVTRIVFDHSAPWYQVRFGVPLATRFFSFSQAFLPDDQRRLVDDVRRGGVQALLHVNGYQALAYYDIHNAFRVPVLEAYLMARGAGVRAINTPLGRLDLWEQPATPGSPNERDPGNDPDLMLTVDIAARSEDSGFAEWIGWAADAKAGQPLSQLRIAERTGPSMQLTYGLDRPDVAKQLGNERLARVGFRLVALEPKSGWAAGGPTLQLVGESGRSRDQTLAVQSARRLPLLAGPAWIGLRDQVEAAAMLGRADRRATAQHEASPKNAKRPRRGFGESTPRGERLGRPAQ
jgi:hypothetical protein